MMNIKRLWNNKEIEVVEINGRWFALCGWNGETYLDCWETDENTFNVEDGKVYEIKPMYNQIEDDDYEVVNFEIIQLKEDKNDNR